jgi:hypothetical protein
MDAQPRGIRQRFSAELQNEATQEIISRTTRELQLDGGQLDGHRLGVLPFLQLACLGHLPLALDLPAVLLGVCDDEIRLEREDLSTLIFLSHRLFLSSAPPAGWMQKSVTPTTASPIPSAKRVSVDAGNQAHTRCAGLSSS